jgi:restriction endonuclease S subunit
MVMKILSKRLKPLQDAERWDIDFHLPAEGIKKFSKEYLKRIDEVATISKDKRDPTKYPEDVFQYVDISSIDISIGVVENPQELLGEEAPSRARKVISAFDIVVSTCRPTRGAIAIIPISLHNQIASTGFSVLRPHYNVNPFYLHYALRLESTLEQFRKWSTGSSYPAILDEDVAKTLIPIPDSETQDKIARELVKAFNKRDKIIKEANAVWSETLEKITRRLSKNKQDQEIEECIDDSLPENEQIYSIFQIRQCFNELKSLTIETKELNPKSTKI